MPIITISRCSYTHGKDVAEAVAKTETLTDFETNRICSIASLMKV